MRDLVSYNLHQNGKREVNVKAPRSGLKVATKEEGQKEASFRVTKSRRSALFGFHSHAGSVNLFEFDSTCFVRQINTVFRPVRRPWSPHSPEDFRTVVGLNFKVKFKKLGLKITINLRIWGVIFSSFSSSF